MIEPDIKRELLKWFDKFPDAKISLFREGVGSEDEVKYKLIKNQSGQLVWRKLRRQNENERSENA